MEGVRAVKRRAFVVSMTTAVGAAIAGLQAQQRRSLRLVVLAASDDAVRRSGEAGVAEVRRMTELLGVGFVCDTVAADARVPASLFVSADAVVLLSNVPRSLPNDGTGVPVITARPLGTGAPPNVFSVRASTAAKAHAFRSSLTAQPGATVTEWHKSLFRYGAEQLNERFVATGITPTADTWCAWLAVKIAAESVLRVSSVRPGAAALRALTFDAHKGMALSFGPDRYLRQPLYVLSGDRVVATVAPEEVDQ
jgi:hypothetical protein